MYAIKGGMMMSGDASRWQSLNLLSIFSEAVNDMLVAAKKQQNRLLQVIEKAQRLDDATSLIILRLYGEQQTNLGRYKDQCQQWRKEKLTSRQRKVIENMELQINALENMNYQILSLTKYLRKHTAYEITCH
jgi:hypothetical protein